MASCVLASRCPHRPLWDVSHARRCRAVPWDTRSIPLEERVRSAPAPASSGSLRWGSRGDRSGPQRLFRTCQFLHEQVCWGNAQVRGCFWAGEQQGNHIRLKTAWRTGARWNHPVIEGHSPLVMGGWLRSTLVPTGGMGWGTAGSVTLWVWGAKIESPLCSQPTMTSLLPGELQPTPGRVENLPMVLWHLGFKTRTSC